MAIEYGDNKWEIASAQMERLRNASDRDLAKVLHEHAMNISAQGEHYWAVREVIRRLKQEESI